MDWFLAYAVLGAFVGFFAGLLGIGGGSIMVPVLAVFYVSQNMATEILMPTALATSMASIVATSFVSMMAHRQRRAVLWPIVCNLVPGMVVGAFLMGLLVPHLHVTFLALFFMFFIGIVAIRMLREPQASDVNRALPGKLVLSGMGGIIGGVSALVAIGGGSLSVPMLTRYGVSIRNAIGTSAAMGVPLSLAATFGYLLAESKALIDPGTVMTISFASVISVPFGAKLAHTLPVELLRRLFAIFLLVLSLSMLWVVMSKT